MKVYSVNCVSNHYQAPIVKNATKPDGILSTSNNFQNVSFGNKNTLKLLAGVGVAALAILNPAAVTIAGLSLFSGIAAYKLVGGITDPNQQKNIAESGKDVMDDIIRDTFPY